MPGKLHDWFHSTFALMLIGALLFWAALPPLQFGPLGWIAPVAWIALVRRKEQPSLAVAPPALRLRWFVLLVIGLFLTGLAVNGLFLRIQYRGYELADVVFWPLLLLALATAARYAGNRPYRTIWLVGFFFWLAVLQWLRLPHWATGFGWIALSFYFAFYFPVFIVVSRAAVHRLRVPVILAAPVVWTALELVRAHLLTGMTMGSLGHTQYRWTQLIQVSDLGGAYAVNFLVMFVGACLGRMLPCDGRPRAFWPLAPAAISLAAVLGYGHYRMSGEYTVPGPRVALIQGCIDSTMEPEEGKQQAIYDEYMRLSLDAVATNGKVDLIVWPESMYSWPWVTKDPDAVKLEGLSNMSDYEFRERIEQDVRESFENMAKTARTTAAPMLMGLSRHHLGPRGEQSFNSSALMTPEGRLLGYYDKMHLVMFGEYVPFADRFPWLQGLTPLPVSDTPGTRPAAFMLGDVCLVPDICYESVLPHVIRRQLRTLEDYNYRPDIMVNVTNDGWFWGSNELDLHLACSVFRAVEFRKPMLVAANTGVSAWIDGDGRIRAELPHHRTGTILADVCLDRRTSFYLAYGDVPAYVCLVATALFALGGMRRRAV